MTKQEYSDTEEGKRRFANPDVYKKTLDFQNELGQLGVAWHNSYSDECTIDFCCCEGKNLPSTNYHTFIPSNKNVVKQAFSEFLEGVNYGEKHYRDWLNNKFHNFIDNY